MVMTLVIHLDLFGRLDVVMDDHIAAAANEGLPHLDGRKPVDVDMRICATQLSSKNRVMCAMFPASR
jgi:hypothetical protein